jgi:thiol-disulfide isomerase/thioredoxin
MSLAAWRNHPARRYLPATLAILGIAAAPFVLIAMLGESTSESVAPEIVGIQSWINSGPLTLAGLRGRVVLVDFWTYTCINCLRTIPHLNGWYLRYRDDGLVVIGVHSPEFAFEHEPDRVARETARLGIVYPVAVDSDKKTWGAYRNQYWPHKYLIDRGGNIRFTQIGEGGYVETESHIRSLLAEDGRTIDPLMAVVTPEPVEPKGIATPEVYFGSHFGQFLGNPLGLRGIGEADYQEPSRMEPNLFYLVGRWSIGEEAVTAVGTGAHRIHLTYTAKAVNFVAAAPGREIEVEVLLDGRAVATDDLGADVVRDGAGRAVMRVSEGRMYRVIDRRAGYGTHTVTLVFDRPGLEAYTFTFG